MTLILLLIPSIRLAPSGQRQWARYLTGRDAGCWRSGAAARSCCASRCDTRSSRRVRHHPGGGCDFCSNDRKAQVRFEYRFSACFHETFEARSQKEAHEKLDDLLASMICNVTFPDATVQTLEMYMPENPTCITRIIRTPMPTRASMTTKSVGPRRRRRRRTTATSTEWRLCNDETRISRLWIYQFVRPRSRASADGPETSH